MSRLNLNDSRPCLEWRQSVWGTNEVFLYVLESWRLCPNVIGQWTSIASVLGIWLKAMIGSWTAQSANVLPTATSLSGRMFKKIVRIPWTGFWMRSAPTIPECPLDSYVGNCFPSRHGQTWVAAPVSNIKLRSFHVECLFHLLVPTEETLCETERT